ncbi:hypothetical protein [Acuticoccus kalidii]|nr:hypothetical protein [Acuticoccus kalidii]
MTGLLLAAALIAHPAPMIPIPERNPRRPIVVIEPMPDMTCEVNP